MEPDPPPPPSLPAREKKKIFPRHGSWQFLVRAKHRGVSTAIGGHHNIIYPAVEWLSVFVGVPTAHLLAGHVEFKGGAMLLSAREQGSFLFRERQPAMAPTPGLIQHGGRF